jgi:hypothetical protein
MDIPKEAWIILYVFNEPSDWVGSFPSEHCQQYYTDTRNGLPTHFDSYKEAVERAEREYLYNYIVVPIAGEQAMNLQKENERLCNKHMWRNPRHLNRMQNANLRHWVCLLLANVKLSWKKSNTPNYLMKSL